MVVSNQLGQLLASKNQRVAMAQRRRDRAMEMIASGLGGAVDKVVEAKREQQMMQMGLEQQKDEREQALADQQAKRDHELQMREMEFAALEDRERIKAQADAGKRANDRKRAWEIMMLKEGLEPDTTMEEYARYKKQEKEEKERKSRLDTQVALRDKVAKREREKRDEEREEEDRKRGVVKPDARIVTDAWDKYNAMPDEWAADYGPEGLRRIYRAAKAVSDEDMMDLVSEALYPQEK